MRYIDIRDQVVRTTNNMECVPVDVMQGVVDNYLGYWEWMNLWEVRHREHYLIKCVVHADMYSYEGSCRVGTVVVDDVPAFFYIESYSRPDGELVGHDSYHILCADACRRFTRYIVNMAVQVAFDTIKSEHGETEVAEDIPTLSTFSGGEIVYGKEYRYIKGKWEEVFEDQPNTGET
jgi:hypothetical protein